jgi:sugar O-acyltransferase (sialic acid O-acetyltransferase NeuD family)
MNIVIAGAGGHGKVVCDALLAQSLDVKGFIDKDPQKWGSNLMDIPILGDIDTLTDCEMAIAMGIGDNASREKVFHRAKALGFRFVNVIHPSAVIGRGCRLGEGIVVFANVVINPDTQIGDDVILNTSCGVDHDCVIESHAHIAPGVKLSGNVTIGSGTLIGIGAAVIPNIKVGAHSIVGAGSVVIRDIPSNCVAVGNPARVIKFLHGA